MDDGVCNGCDYNSHDLIVLGLDQQKYVNFLTSHKLIKKTCICNSCGQVLGMNVENQMFRCSRSVTIKQNKKKARKIRCNFLKSAKSLSWFQNSSIPIATVLGITYDWLAGQPIGQCRHERRVSSSTVISWYHYCREVVEDYCYRNKSMLGGKDVVVEIDEKKYGRKKIKKEVSIPRWVFGGVEKDSGKIFLVTVDDRSEETLLAVIKDWIIPGSTIITDTFKSYSKLN